MKQYFTFLRIITFFCLTTTFTFGQNSPYYCYTPDGKIELELYTQNILVKFEAGIDNLSQLDLLKQYAPLSSLKREHILSFHEVLFIELPENATESLIENLLIELNQQPGIEYAHPFFKMNKSDWITFDKSFFVGLKSEADLHWLQEMAALHAVDIIKQSRYDGKQYLLKATTQSSINTLAMANIFAESNLFEYAEVDFFTSSTLSGNVSPPSNDPNFAEQWHLKNTGAYPIWPTYSYNGVDIDAEAAWATTTGSPNIRIAVIDDGVNTANSDLIGNLAPGYDATSQGAVSTMISATGHGNNVAEVIAAVGNNNIGGIGVAYTSKIIPIKIYEQAGVVSVSRNSWTADGIDWAWEEGNADILNNSWGGGFSVTIINNAISRAVSQGRGGLGSPLLFAAGNNGNNFILYPANLTNVIAVGGTNSCDFRRQRTNAPSCDGNHSWASDYGTGLDIAAPGNYITTSSGNFEGTSASTPIAAGIMALILSKNPSLTATQARFYLESTCEKVGGYTYNNNVAGQPNGTWSDDLGYGRVNANLALAAVPAPPANDAGVAIITSPVSNCGLSSSETVTVLIKNYGSSSFSNLAVQYRIKVNNNSWGTWTTAGTFAGPLASFAEANHTFPINVSAVANYMIEVRTQLVGDAVSQNDVSSYAFVHRPTITSYPYVEDFETTDGDWYPSAANNPWQWETPFSGNVHIKGAGNGNKCWYTVDDDKTNGYFPFQSETYLYSPCLDFSAMTNDPVISFLLIYHLEQNNADYVYLELSTDGGATWNTVGAQGSGTNWYNQINGWAGISQNGAGNWLPATQKLVGAAGESDARVRFVFFSDNSDPYEEGIGVDKIEIFEPSNNDASISSIDSPIHNCIMGAMESVEVKIQNLGNAVISSCPVQYRYQINGGNFTSWTAAGTYNGSITPGATDFHFFTADFSAKGTYNLEIRTQLSGDGNVGNDLASHTFQHYNAINTFPYTESFETGQGIWLKGGVNYTWEVGTPTGNIINAAADGTKAWVTNLTGFYNTEEQSYVQSPCFDFSNTTSPQINLDIWRDTESTSGGRLEYSTDGGGSWSPLGAYNDPNNWYNSANILGLNNGVGWTNNSASWETAIHDLTSLAGQANVLFRMYFGASTGINTSKEGFAFDNLLISESNFTDVGIAVINKPYPFGCSMSNTQMVEVTLKNYGNVTVSNIPVDYRINTNNNGFGNWMSGGIYAGAITAGNTATLSFTADFSTLGDHTFEVRTQLGIDQNAANDGSSKLINHRGANINTFPVCFDFENNTGGWQPYGNSSSWAWGTPNNTTINAASGGAKAWVTNLTGDYNDTETSYLLSPCLDFINMNFGIISFDLWYETESGKDGLQLQYSINGGDDWTTEAIQVNAYNNNNITTFSGFDSQEGWSGSSGQWITAQAFISPLGTPDILYRFVFVSDGATAREGVAIDNICIYDADANDISTIPGCSSAVVKNISGNNQINILDANGANLAYFSPNGNDLGTVTLNVNDMASVPQADGSVYYMPRYFDFSCSGGADCPTSGNFSQGTVTVGLYFVAQELTDYNTAGGTNYVIGDLYSTHFDGNNENCTLNDNVGGTYSLINKSSIWASDYNNGAGFFLEFNVSSWSEFGAHATAATLMPPPALPLKLTAFNAWLVDESTILLNWETAAELHTSHFEIMRSVDGKNWEYLGEISAKVESNASNEYKFHDQNLPFITHQNLVFYRLKIVDLDNSFAYSPIKSVAIDKLTKPQFTIYPNPTKDGINISLNIRAQTSDWEMVLTDVFGKTKIHKQVKASASSKIFLDFQGANLPPGIYLLNLFEGKQLWESKRIVLMK